MRPLAPKPSSRRRAYSAISSRSRPHRPRTSSCNVPICPHETCTLRSHQLYGARSILSSAVERPIYDETQILGLEDAFERHLFQYCLNNMLEQKMLVYGPAYPMTYDISEMRNILVGAAVTSRHSTLVIISIAYCDVLHQSSAPAEQLDRMYDKLKVAMRQELDIEKVLMFIIAQSIIDRHRGRDVQPHRRVLGEVAKDRIHTLTRALHYIVEADRRLAVWTKSLPTIQNMESNMNGFQYLEEARALIRVFERDRRSMESSRITPVSPYCYYKREELSNAFTRIHALREGKEWCVAVAARIIEFQITFEGELKSCVSMMIDCLVEGLRTKLKDIEWSKDKETLIWILFIVGDAWTIRRLLEEVHGPQIPTSQEQWDMITTNFVWAEGLRPQFDRTFEAVTQCIIRSDGAG